MTVALQKKAGRAWLDNDGVENARAVGGWTGEISIKFSCLDICSRSRLSAGDKPKTVMTSVKHIGPLRVQRPFYPEGDVCHVYLLHPPGGVVGGDSLDTTITCQDHSHALMTTPGSTKFYRSAGEYAQAGQTLKIESGCVLEWFPQENMFFPGAKAKIKTCIQLEGDAKFIGWEINCLGRPANAEKFESGIFDASFIIMREEETVLIERQRVFEKRQLTAPAGLRNYPMNAIFICTSCTEEHLELARETVAGLETDFPVGITLMGDILVLRTLGESTEKLQAVMISVWRKLRLKILNKAAVLPRIWST